MKTLEYLRQGGSLEKLVDELKLVSRPHEKYPQLILLKYDQIASDFAHPIVRECRGLVLDRDDNWRVVSRSLDKFFNHGEGHAAQLHWPSAKTFQKLDGSLMVLYHYDGTWHVQSSGTADAGGNVNGSAMSFKELFWTVWSKLGYKLPEDTDLCYGFELMTLANKVVVAHKEPRIVLHTVRNRTEDSGYAELAPEPAAEKYGWECVKSSKLGSIEEVVAAAQALNGLHNEGFVICDENFARVKVKNLDYVQYSHMKDGFGPRRMLELVCKNESPEFLSYFPEFTDMYKEIDAKYQAMLAELDAVYAEIKDIPVQKDFALKATKHRMSGALFALRGGKVKSLPEYFLGFNAKALGEYLGLKDITFEV